MRLVSCAAAVLASLGLSGCWAPQAGSPIPSYDGARLYRANCASCHGMSGAGDGPMVPQLTQSPSDLRSLSQRNNGVFPRMAVARQIDGRDMRAVHGTRDMPVWGWEFRQRDTDRRDPAAQAAARIEAVVDFVESLQQPPG